jgi:cytoskeletal protein CcmA (bactofilin family)
VAKRRSLDHLEKLPTILSRDSVHIGPLDGREHYVVHGRVQGDGQIDGMLMIGPDCLWIGNVEADVVIVKGRVEGNVHARFKLEVRPSARIKGDLTSPLVAIADGAVVQGTVSADSIVTRFTERRTH